MVTGRPSIASSVALMSLLHEGEQLVATAVPAAPRRVLLRIIFRRMNSGSSAPLP